MLVPLLLLASLAFSGTLAVTIRDEAGKPVPARVYVTDSNGKSHFAPDTIVYDRVRPGGSEQHFVPPGGVFSIELAAGKYSLTVERGKEYLPVSETIPIPDQGRVERTIRLQRWVRMKDLGWYSADMHSHRPLADMITLLQAEDLDLGLPITRWRNTAPTLRQDPELPQYLARADSAGMLRVNDTIWMTVLNEELEPRGSALLTTNLGRTPLELQYPLPDYGKRAVDRKVLVDSEKATSWELPAIAALGGCQFVGLANNHMWRSGAYLTPWGAWPDDLMRRHPQTCEGFAMAGFDMYYALLNMGFPLKVSAGSANGVHAVPLGWSRLYVKVDGVFHPDKWFEGARRGRSFATTGPMLLLKANGLEPGGEARGLAFPLEVTAEVEMRSPSPQTAAEIVVNGKAQQVSLSPSGNNSYRGILKLKLDGSSWIAARWTAKRGNTCDVAHTSPIYFWRGTDAVPIPRLEAQYLLERVEKMIREVEGASSAPADGKMFYDSPDVRARTLEMLRAARAVYREKLAQSK